MARAFRPLRTRFARLLASVLVIGTLLGNGMVVAQAQPAPAKEHCCAERMGHSGTHKGGCDEGRQPCPAPSASCSDQCLVRCQSNIAMPVFAFVLPARYAGHPVLPLASADERPLTDPGPGLRPPISA